MPGTVTVGNGGILTAENGGVLSIGSVEIVGWAAWDGSGDGSNQNIINSGTGGFILNATRFDTDEIALIYRNTAFTGTCAASSVFLSGNTITQGSAGQYLVGPNPADNNADITLVDSNTVLFTNRSNTTTSSAWQGIAYDISPAPVGTYTGGSIRTLSTGATFTQGGNYLQVNRFAVGEISLAQRLKGNNGTQQLVRTVSGNSLNTVNTATGSDFAAVSNTFLRSFGGGDEGGHGDVGNSRVAFLRDSTNDNELFFTSFSNPTLSVGSLYDTSAIDGPSSSFCLEKIIDEDHVLVTYSDTTTDDLSGVVLTLTGNEVTGIGTPFTLRAGEEWLNVKMISTAANQVMIIGDVEEDADPGNRDIKVAVVTFADVNSPTVETVVDIDPLHTAGAGNARPQILPLDSTRILTMWNDGTANLQGRVLNLP